MASTSLSSLSSSFSTLSFSSQVSPKSQTQSFLVISSKPSSTTSKTSSLTISATSAEISTTPLESDALSIEKYVKSRLPGGFAAQTLIGTARRKCAIACVVLQEGTGKVIINYRDAKVETLLDTVKWDDKGLAVAIAQDVDTGAILMQGFVNKEALATTISSRKATFYSRSRSSLWTKGETSNNFININDIFLDCDRDSIIYLGKPDGPTCHTGSDTCYYSSVNDFLEDPEVKENNRFALTTLYNLESIISQRKAEISGSESGKPSWTKKLLLDQKLMCSKIREEAGELCQTLEDNEDKSRAAAEAADLIFHSMVLLKNKDVKMEEVMEVLRHRFSQSGIEEKSSRKMQSKD